MKKFVFTVENIEEIFSEISCLRQFKERKLSSLKIECEDKNFLYPLEDVFINLSLSQFDNNLSLLGIIKSKSDKNAEILSKIGNYFSIKSGQIDKDDYFLILDENLNPEFTIRNIENFGIYIYAGRPDLGHYMYNSVGISLNCLENFKNKLEKFAKLVELLVNEAYRLNGIELRDNIEYKLVLNKPDYKIKQVNEIRKEIPEALKRLYARIGNG